MRVETERHALANEHGVLLWGIRNVVVPIPKSVKISITVRVGMMEDGTWRMGHDFQIKGCGVGCGASGGGPFVNGNVHQTERDAVLAGLKRADSYLFATFHCVGSGRSSGLQRRCKRAIDAVVNEARRWME